MSDLIRIGTMITAPSKAEIKRMDVAAEMRSRPASEEDMCSYPAVLCQVGMPRRRTGEKVFERRDGLVTLTMQVGKLRIEGKDTWQPLPYGPKPRLILATVTTIVKQTGKRFIPIGRTLRDFMRKMGLDPQGSEYRSMRQQMLALAACHMTITDTIDGVDVTKQVGPISEFRCGMWGGTADGEPAPWSEVQEVSDKYFEYVMLHSVPLDERAIAGLRGSALALDIYAWLAHRLVRVRNPNGEVLPWNSLRVQFGQEYGRADSFRQEFRSALMDVRAYYQDARIAEVKKGIQIWESKPPIPKRGSHRAC